MAFIFKILCYKDFGKSLIVIYKVLDVRLYKITKINLRLKYSQRNF